MRFAYADPPYIGQSRKHYKNHPDYAGEVDHRKLLCQLVEEYPDGWALSCSSPSLPLLTGILENEMGLHALEGDYRITPWCKPFCSFKPGVGVAFAWEPVIWRGGRKRDREQATARDFILANITLKRGLVGAKPEKFCFELFDLLGAKPGDELEDLFPGTRAITEAWGKYVSLKEGRPIQGAML